MAMVQPASQGDLAAILAELRAMNANLAAQAAAQYENLPQPYVIQQVIPLPVSPATLVQAIFASQAPGVAAPQFLSFATSVPALGSATLTYDVPVGYSLLFVGDFTLESTYYDPGITATLVVDRQNVLYEDFPIDKSYHQVLPQYGVIHQSMVATFVNETTQDAVIETSGEAVLLQDNLYQGIVLALLKAGYRQIELFAENQVALGRVD